MDKPVDCSHLYAVLTHSLTRIGVNSWKSNPCIWADFLPGYLCGPVRIKILKGNCVSHSFPTVFNLNNLYGMGCLLRWCGILPSSSSPFFAYIRNPEENYRIYLTECCKCWLDVIMDMRYWHLALDEVVTSSGWK